MFAAAAAGLLCMPAMGLQQRSQPRKVFRQVLSNMADVQYYGSLSIGEQAVNAVYDTGSFELLVLSRSCGHCGDASAFYDSAASKAHKYGNMSVMHSFGSGTLYSKEAYDTVRNGPYKALNAPFWEVYDANMPVLKNSHIESIAGLAPFPSHFDQMHLHGSNSEAYASIQAGLNINSFAICLGSEPESAGHIVWNDNSPSTASDSFSEIPLMLESAPHWTAPLQNVRLGDEVLGCDGHCGGIIDSGTSLLAVPQPVAIKLQGMVSKLFTDCSDLSSLPHLHFRLGGVELSLPPDSYVYRTQGGSDGSSCKALVMTLDLPESEELGQMWILGMPFLRKYYTVFEQHPARVFVSEADKNCEPKHWGENQDESLQGGTRTNVIRPRNVDVQKVRWPSWLKRSTVRMSGSVLFSELSTEDPTSRSTYDESKNNTGDEEYVEFGQNTTVPRLRQLLPRRNPQGGKVIQIPLSSQLEVSAGKSG